MKFLFNTFLITFIFLIYSSCLSYKIKKAKDNLYYQFANLDNVNHVPSTYYVASFRHNDSLARIYNEWHSNYFTEYYILEYLSNFKNRKIKLDILNILRTQNRIIADTTFGLTKNKEYFTGYLYPKIVTFSDTLFIYYKYTVSVHSVELEYGRLAYFTRYLLPYIYFPIELDLPQSRIYFTIIIPKADLKEFQQNQIKKSE